jgi:tetraacyldisaccharide 4'-kinase
MPFSPPKLFRLALFPFSALYGGIVAIRNFCYQKQLFKVSKLSKPTISVGNISVGGTGKTPVVKYLCDYFTQLNNNVVVLTRGYGRKSNDTVFIKAENLNQFSVEQTGDEPRILASGLQKGFVGIDANRSLSGKIASQEFNPDLFILDDAFQHRKVHRDIDIVTMSAFDLWGGKKLLPVGRLRESINQLNRADLFWITKSDQADQDKKPIEGELNSRFDKPIIFSEHFPKEILNINQTKSLPVDFLQNKTAIAFCGIANPDSFKRSLEKLGVTVVELFGYKDHYHFQPEQILKLVEQKEKTNADLLITTEKDAMRIEHYKENWQNSILFLKIGIKITNGGEKLKKMFENKGLIS